MVYEFGGQVFIDDAGRDRPPVVERLGVVQVGPFVGQVLGARVRAGALGAVDDAQGVIIALPTLYADGSQTRSFCYVDDVVDGLIYLADSSAAEPDNLGNPNEMSVSDFADVVANLVGDTGRIYKDLPVSDPVRRQPDISLALSELGWEPVVPLVDGLQRTTAYLRDVRS